MAKTSAPSMPRTMGRGFASVRPHWMTVRDAPKLPSQPPASNGTPCVPQLGVVGSLSSKPSPFAPQPMETHVFHASPSSFSLDYKGSLQGHVETRDIDDDDIGESGPPASPTLEDFVSRVCVSPDNTKFFLEDAVKCSHPVCLNIS